MQSIDGGIWSSPFIVQESTSVDRWGGWLCGYTLTRLVSFRGGVEAEIEVNGAIVDGGLVIEAKFVGDEFNFIPIPYPFPLPSPIIDVNKFVPILGGVLIEPFVP